MSEFIQLHLLVSYPPSNLNRDDLGRPKTAIMGGKTRLRISSQSLKRAWRTSDIFASAVPGHTGIRTKNLGVYIKKSYETGMKLSDLLSGNEGAEPVFTGIDEEKASAWARVLSEQTGKLKGAESLSIEQLTHFDPSEISALEKVIAVTAASLKEPGEEDTAVFLTVLSGVDIAMFGRMLAASPRFNIEAAVQVAHAITVNTVVIEDDYFTAVDDLNRGEENIGAGHLGEMEFGSGVFYLYLCINRSLLLENLDNDKDLANKALAALVEATAKVSPSGKQSTFASRAYASYMMVEKGTQQPRSLSVAFLKPVTDNDILAAAIARLNDTKLKMDTVYGPCADSVTVMDASAGTGSLKEIIAFVKE